MSKDRFEAWLRQDRGLSPDAVNTPTAYRHHLEIATTRLRLMLGNDEEAGFVMPVNVFSPLYREDYPLHYLVEVLSEVRGEAGKTSLGARRGGGRYSIELFAHSARNKTLASMEFGFSVLPTFVGLELKGRPRLLEDDLIKGFQQQPFNIARVVNLLSRELPISEGRKSLSLTRPWGLGIDVAQTSGFKPKPLG